MKNAFFVNPYTPESDKFHFWEMLIKNDFEGFLSGNWNLIENDFHSELFFGFDFRNSSSGRHCRLTYPTLESYKKQWLEDSDKFRSNKFLRSPRERLYSLTKLENIEVYEKSAAVHKVFNGTIELVNKEPINLSWRSIFLLQKINQEWFIVGFNGYMKE